jgi:hypothetical protein
MHETSLTIPDATPVLLLRQYKIYGLTAKMSYSHISLASSCSNLEFMLQYDSYFFSRHEAHLGGL